MLFEISFWFLPVFGVLCGAIAYLVAHLRSAKTAQSLIAENNEIALELDSIKVTCVQLESALEGVELLHKSKNQFYSSTSHDLRQPLHALAMFSSVLQKQKLDDLSKEIAADISDAVFDVTREIDVLLNIARVDVEILKLHPVKIDLSNETRRIVHQFHRQAKSKGLDLEVHSTTKALVYLDRSLFDRVLRNLIDNAIKFTDQGYVRVTIGHTQENTLLLSVVDTGIGISKEDQEGIYREFYQGRNLSANYLTGVGLGLNTVLKMIVRLGGEINIESTGASGTNVTVEIPNLKGVFKVQNSSENIDNYSQINPTLKKVLVLESDILAGKSTRMLLESAGYGVVLVSSMSEAHVIQKTQDIDAACLEIASSEEAAKKLIEALRSLKPDMPIVVMASDKGSTTKYSDPGIAVLLKPVNPGTLLQKLARSS